MAATLNKGKYSPCRLLTFFSNRSPYGTPSHSTQRYGARFAITVAVAMDKAPSRPPLQPFLSKQHHELHILGAGAVGLYLSCKLRFAYPSFPLHVLIRGSRESGSPSTNFNADARRGNVLVSFQQYDGTKNRMRTIPIPFERICSSNGKVIRNLVVCTKAYSAVDAISLVQNRFLEPEKNSLTNIVLLCNGALAVRDELLDLIQSNSLPRTNIHVGYTTHGIIRGEKSSSSMENDDDVPHEHIRQAGVGHIQLPSTWGFEQNVDWTRLWNTAGLDCRPAASSTEMEMFLWLKLGANCVINPLTALYHCTNGELPVLVPDFAKLQRVILDEVCLVAQDFQRRQRVQQPTRQGDFEATHDPGTTSSHHHELSLGAMIQFCSQVIIDTRDNKSSMLQDILSNRRPELDHLTGYVVRKGREFGISTPENARMFEQVQKLSAKGKKDGTK